MTVAIVKTGRRETIRKYLDTVDDYASKASATFASELLLAAVGIESTTCARVLDALDELRDTLASIRADLADR